MMTHIRTFFLITLILVPIASYAQPVAEAQNTLSKKLTLQLAIGQQLAESADEVRDQFRGNPLRLSDENNQNVLAAFKKAYSKEHLTSDFTTALPQKLDAPYTDTILHWLELPETRAITDALQKYYTLQGKRERVIAMYKMDQQPVPEEKTKQIKALMDTTETVNTAVESSAIMLKSLIRASDRVSNKRNLSKDQIDAIVGNFKTQLRARAPKEIRHELLIKFYHISHQKLKQYIHFYESNAGRQLNQAINQSMHAAYQSAANRFLKAL